MSEINMENNINQLVQEIERIKNILTDRNLYGIGLSPKLPRRGRGFHFNFYLKLTNDIGENIYNIYYPRSTESTAFKKLLETRIAMTIGIEEYNFYKDAVEEDEKAFLEGSRSQDGNLSYSDLVKLNAYIDLFHSISNRAKDLIKFMITNNIEEALDISTAVESLNIIGINKSPIEIENLCREAKELINNGICENFKDAFAILLDTNIDNLMEEKIQNSVVAPRIRILELKQNSSNLSTGHSITGKKALKLNINKYLNDGIFENLSEVYNLCVDPTIDYRYKNNPFKEIFRRLDQGEKLMESDIKEIEINIKNSLKDFNKYSTRKILKKFSKPELVNVFNELANDKFENLGNFIVYELNKNLEEVLKRERRDIEIQQTIDEVEIQRIKDRNSKMIEEQQAEVQARCIQLLDTEIFQESESNQEVNISGFESIIHANSKLSISTIYQSCIAGLIMFSVDKDPLEELFTEVDKIINKSIGINEKKYRISEKMGGLKDEINNFLGQIDENDREKLKIYLSNLTLQRIFNEKTNNLYSELILSQIITMMAGFEKNTGCCIY